MLNLPEIDFIIIFLQKSYNICFGVFFDISLVIPWLWVIYVDSRLNLSYRVDILDLS